MRFIDIELVTCSTSKVDDASTDCGLNMWRANCCGQCPMKDEKKQEDGENEITRSFVILYF